MSKDIRIDIHTTANLKDLDNLIAKINTVVKAVESFNKTGNKSSSMKGFSDAAKNIDKVGKSATNAKKATSTFAKDIVGMTRTLSQQAANVKKVTASYTNQESVARRMTKAEKDLAAAEKSRADAQRRYMNMKSGQTQATKEELAAARQELTVAEQFEKRAKANVSSIRDEIRAYHDLETQQKSISKTIQGIYKAGNQPGADITKKFAAGNVALQEMKAALGDVAAIDKRMATLGRSAGGLTGRLSQTKADVQALNEETVALEKVAAAQEKLDIAQARAAARNQAAAQRQADRDLQNFIRDQERAAQAAQRLAQQMARWNFRSQISALQGLSRVFSTLQSAISKVMGPIRQFISTLGQLASRGLSAASRAVGTLTNSASSMFARLRSALDGTGSGFLGFGKSAQTGMSQAQKSIQQFYSAGWSLLTSGAILNRVGDRIFGSVGNMMNQYMDYERSLTRTAISAAEPITGPGGDITGYKTNPDILQRTIFDIQRGNANRQGVYQFNANDLAQGLYYYTSAIGQPVTEQNKQQVADVVSSIMQMAAVTQTAPETAVKGAVNVALEFGIDPRDVHNAKEMQNIAAQMGYLANLSTMEVPDITETFKMLGPMAHILSGKKTPGAGLNEAMTLAFFGSEVGLRGSNIGRGINQALTTLLDPTDKAIATAADTFGIGVSKEAFKSFFFNAKGELQGGLPGLFDKLSRVPSEKAASFLAELFTTNATRAVVGIQQAIDQHGGIQGILEDMAGKKPMQWLSEAVLATNDTIFGNFQNLQNAWFATQTAIVDGISTTLKPALKLLADMFWHVADVIADNPGLAKFLGYLVTITGAVATFVGALFVMAGTSLLAARAFAMLGGMIRPFLMLMVAIPRMLLLVSPVLLLITAAVVALYTAWTSNFLGMQDAVKNFVKNFSIEKDLIPRIEAVITWIARLGAAVKEFIAGILMGVGPVNNLGAVLMSFFGPMTGSYFFQQLLNLQKGLEGFRQSFKNFVSDLTSNAGKIHDVTLIIQGFIEEIIFGTARSEAAGAQADLGKALGIDNLPTLLLQAANAIRNFVGMSIGYIKTLADAMSGNLARAWQNLTAIFSGNNLEAALGALSNLLKGIAEGFATALVGATKAIAAFTGQLARAGKAGNWIADHIKKWTGLGLTINNVAESIGIAIGTFLGTRLVVALIPGANMILQLGTYVGQLGVKFAGAAVQMGLFLARVAVEGAVIAAQTALYIAQGAAIAGLAVAKAGITVIMAGLALAQGAEATAMLSGVAATVAQAAAMVGLEAAAAPLLVVFGAIAVVLGAVAAGGLILAGIFTAITAAMLVHVAVTQGLQAAWDALVQVFNGFMSVAVPIATVIAGIALEIGKLVASFAQAVFGGNQFEAMGKLIAISLAGLIVPVIALIGLFGALVVAIAGVVAEFIVMNAPILIIIAVIAEAAGHILNFFGITDNSGILGALEGVAKGLGIIYDAAKSAAGAINDLLKVDLPKNKTHYVQGQLVPNDWAHPSLQDQAAAELYQQGRYQPTQAEIDKWNAAHGGMHTVQLPMGGGTQTLDPIEYDQFLSEQYRATPQVGGQGQIPSKVELPKINIKDMLGGVVTDLAGFFGLPTNQVQDLLSGKMPAVPQQNEAKFTADAIKLFPKEAQIEYAKQKDAYQTYLDTIEKLGQRQANALYKANDMPIPKAPTIASVLAEMGGENADAATQAAQETIDAIEKMKGDISDAVKGADMGDVLAGMFDSGLGKGGKSAFSAIYEMTDKILGNIGDKGPWLNPTEILADVAGTGTGAWNVAGKNLQKALRPQLEIIAEQTGVSISDMLKDVPKFIAPDQFIPMATGELIKGLSTIGESVYKKLDVIGTDIYDQYGNQMEQYGLDWAELTTYAVGQAIAGNDWNLSDYLAESWGISIDEANQYLADHGIDANLINQKWFKDTQELADSLNGQVAVVTEDQMTQLAALSDNFTKKTLNVTRAQFDALSDGAKIGFTKLGYTFVIGGETAAGQAVKTAQSFVDSFRSAYLGPDGVAHGFRQVGDVMADGMVQIRDVVTGETFTVPAVDYEAYKESVEQIKAVNEEFKKNMADRLKAIQGDLTGGPVTPPSSILSAFGGAYKDVYGSDALAAALGKVPDVPIPDNSKAVAAADKQGVEEAQVHQTAYANSMASDTQMSTATVNAVTQATTAGVAAVTQNAESYTAPGVQAGQNFGKGFTEGVQQAFSAGLSNIGSVTGATLNPFGDSGATAVAGPFDAMFQGFATSALQAFAKEMSPEKIQNAISLATASVGTGQAQETGPFDSQFEGYGYSALTHFASKISSDFSTVIGDKVSGIATGDTSPFDTQFENYATTAVNKFWAKIPDAWASNPKTFLATGAGAAAAGGGSSPFDTQFENYATFAIQKFWDKVSSSWNLNMPTLTASGSPFDSVFTSYAQSAAQAFKDAFEAALAGWQPNMGPQSGRGTNADQFDATGMAPAPTAQTMSMKLTLDTSDFDTKLAGISTAIGAIASTPFQAVMTADTATFYDAYDAAFSAGYAWRDAIFTSHLNGDATNFYGAYDAVFASGQTFAAQVFTSTLDGDAGPFYKAYSDAFAAGYVWDAQTFSATLSVNDYATGVINNLSQALTNLDGRTATVTTTTVNTTVNETVTKQSNAAGGIIHAASGYAGIPAGLSFVGERGMELTALPAGTRVVSNARTMNMLKMAMGSALRDTPQQLYVTADKATEPQPTTSFAQSDAFRRDPSWVTPAPQAPNIQITVENINISKEMDIDEAVKRFDRLIGHRMELTKRGVMPVDTSTL